MNYQVHRQSGLTLVELMVATALSLVLLSGVLLVFSANKSTYQLQSGLGTLQENGRYAVRQISADLKMAGFGGCLSPRLAPRIVMVARSPTTPANFVDDFSAGEFFTGVNDDGGSTSYGAFSMVAGTDSIEIRGPLGARVSFVTGETQAAGNVTVVGTNNDFAANDYVMISDCGGADIFRATTVGTGGGNTQIAHANTLNLQATLSRRYGADSVVTELRTHTYFVADTGRTNTAVPPQPILALYRFDGTTAQELVDGVENLQIDFALDTDADDTIDAFAGPGGVTNWDEVMAARISLLINSVNGASATEAPYNYFPASSVAISPGTGDFRLRQEFTAMVSVRNSVL